MGGGAGSSFGKEDGVDELEEGAGGLSDMSGFSYPRSTRCEVMKDENEFEVACWNSRNTSKVIGALLFWRNLRRAGGAIDNKYMGIENELEGFII
ncbi:arginine repressor-like protein [Encephalitozoon cuniculi]|nr:DUF1609 domain-containing protein [Encephalitozoon cuniculi]UYI28382.1 arginine repressor-like protein [Encephalitozoon cuniculi]